MRRPTSKDEAFAWWRAALRGKAVIASDDPQCGFYKRRLVKGGPFVPARIWLDQDIDPETGELRDDERLQCEVNGGYADPYDAWQWLCGAPITEQEFRYMEALREHAAIHEPDHPMADPRKAIDHLKTPLHF
jgi:hypothetical protein